MALDIYRFCHSLHSFIFCEPWSELPLARHSSPTLTPCASDGVHAHPNPKSGHITEIWNDQKAPSPWPWNWFREEHRIQVRSARVQSRTLFSHLKNTWSPLSWIWGYIPELLVLILPLHRAWRWSQHEGGRKIHNRFLNFSVTLKKIVVFLFFGFLFCFFTYTKLLTNTNNNELRFHYFVFKQRKLLREDLA